jgi:phosphate transport system substrate-binding protein
MRNRLIVASALLVLAAFVVSQAQAAEVRLSGAASMVTGLIGPGKAAVEKATGDTVSVASSNAGKGLIDLVDGKCDASLASAEISTVVKAAQALGREVDGSKLKMTVVASDEIVFVVHPSNKVTKLTWEQLGDIHTGKIVNWKEVDGNDAPILVFTDAEASATRGMIKQVVMKNKEYASSAAALDHVSKVNDMVALHPNSIGGLGKGFVKTGQVAVVETKKIERPFGFITIGEPRGEVKKVIEAYRKEAGTKK